MDYIKHNRLAIGIVCMAIISFVMLTQECSWSAEPSLKINADKHNSEKKVKDNQTPDKKDHKVIVFYFHGNVRCFTCKRIEQLTKEAVKEEFGEEMKNGAVEMKAINVEEPKNNHFIRDYRLYTRSVIVSDLKHGKQERWKNLLRVWELARNDEAFKRYVQKEVKVYLEGKES
ncbi:MAG: nitrophenyl compound nitroreductase subunit ArsF family protein [Desulfatiglandales bacterium]